MNAKFWKCAAIRAARTFAQTAVACLSTAALLSEADWLAALSASTLAALLSILTSVAAGLPEAETDGTAE